MDGEGSRHPCNGEEGQGRHYQQKVRGFLKREANKKILHYYNYGFWKFSIVRRIE
jgi:hypothetical protein